MTTATALNRYRTIVADPPWPYEGRMRGALLGRLVEALVKIEQGRPNRTYDPWAQEVARKALLEVSSRVTDMLADECHDRETISGG